MRTRFLATAAAVATLTLAGCAGGGGGTGGEGSGGESSPPEEQDLSIRIIGIGQPDFTAVDVVKWQENLEEAGFDVEFTSVEEEDSALRSVVAGAADCYIGSLPSMITAVQNTDAPVELVAVNNQATSYVVLAENSIETIDDLADATIGVNTPGSAGDTIMRLALEAEGFDTDLPEYVIIGGTSARVAALQAGQVQATVAHLVTAEAAIETGNFHALLYAGPAIGPYVQTGLICSTEYTDGNSEAAQQAVNALIEAERWAANEKEEYIELSQTVDEESSDELRDRSWDSLSEIEFWAVNGGLADEGLIDGWIQTSIEAGDFEEGTMPAKEEWLDPQFVENYLEENGTV